MSTDELSTSKALPTGMTMVKIDCSGLCVCPKKVKIFSPVAENGEEVNPQHTVVRTGQRSSKL